LTQSGEKEKKRYVTVILRILVATGALYLVFRGEDLRELADIMLGLNLWLFAAALGQVAFAFEGAVGLYQYMGGDEAAFIGLVL
jgi:hypothetical protein